MAIIKPFKAIRPLQDKVAAVVTRSYHDYSPKERELTLKRNPFSFLHIINPEFKSNEKIPDRERFNLIHKSYLEFISEGILIKDAGNSFYLYKIKKDHRTYCGLLCATSTEDYQNNCIKKHEYTLHRREKLFAKYLKTVKFNAEPVLMTYRDDPGIAAIMKEETTNSPEYEFTTPDRVTHLLWTIKDTTTIEKLQSAFAQIDALYIADGHHRSASSDLLSKMYKKGNPDHTGKEPYNYFMSYLIPESEIDISEFNRMVKGLNGLSREAFLMRLNKYYKVENKGINVYTPKKNMISACI